jgi:hypothetical protein
MSKTPDLSAFPIPRKGTAKPISGDEIDEARGEGGDSQPPEEHVVANSAPSGPEPEPVSAPLSPPTSSRSGGGSPRATRSAVPIRAPTPPPPQSYGQMVATTVKLDENRYLRLVEAGKPAPGRLRRRTIQDMLIEALDEWFERRQL